jgi:hypothetical protein
VPIIFLLLSHHEQGAPFLHALLGILHKYCKDMSEEDALTFDHILIRDE